MIKAINIETEWQFKWMVREMRGLNKSHKPEVNKPSLSQNNNKEDGIPPTNKLVGILPKEL